MHSLGYHLFFIERRSLYDRYKTEISAEEYAELLGLTIYAVKNFKNNPNLRLRIRGKKDRHRNKKTEG